MSIHDEIKDIVRMMMEHPEEIDRLEFFIKLRNGNVFRYHMDRKKEEQLMIAERLRRQKIEKKMKEIELKEIKQQNLANNNELLDNTSVEKPKEKKETSKK